MWEAVLSALAAILVGFIGVSNSWNGRQALKDDLEIARVVRNDYPENSVLQKQADDRVVERLSGMARLNHLLPTMRMFGFAFMVAVLGIILEFIKPWMVRHGSLFATLAQLLNGSAGTLSWISRIYFAAAILMLFPKEWRAWSLRQMRRLGRGFLAKLFGAQLVPGPPGESVADGDDVAVQTVEVPRSESGSA